MRIFHHLLATLLALFTFASTLHLSSPPTTDLTKRLPSPRGGGGRGGFGGIGGGGRIGGGGGGRVRPPPSTRPSSNTGGRTSTGSGVQPHYGGYYLGGSRVPYRAGALTPGRSVVPFLLVGGGLGFWAGSHWGPGAYAYRFPANVTFHNSTTGRNETLPALCLCQRYLECSCEVNGNTKYVQGVLGDGSYAALSQKEDLVRVVPVNGSRSIVLNGTLANGTTVSGASRGGSRSGMLENAVWGIGAAAVGWGIWCF